MIDVHQHSLVFPEDVDRFTEYLRSRRYRWGYGAVRHGGWTAVTTANILTCLMNTRDVSFIRFEDLVDEVGMMLWDLGLQADVVKVSNADEIESAKQQGKPRIPANRRTPGHRE